MRILAVLVLALSLDACVTRDPYVTMAGATKSGNWIVENQVDRVTGAPSSGILLMTRNSSNSSVPNNRPASVRLTCFESQPIVRIAFGFKIGSDRNSILGYRFDDRPGHDNVESRILLGYEVIVIENRAEVAKFVDELVASNVLYVRIRSMNAGRTSAEFQLDGAAGAVPAAFKDCPLTSPPVKRTA